MGLLYELHHLIVKIEGPYKETNIRKDFNNRLSLFMAIRVDISYVARDLRYIILNSAEVKSNSINHRSNENNNDKDVIIFADENNIQNIKQIIQRIFTQNHINDYIVAENTEVENEIAILKQGDMEQFGIYICTHCGMSFESEIQRTVHQRLHYFT